MLINYRNLALLVFISAVVGAVIERSYSGPIIVKQEQDKAATQNNITTVIKEKKSAGGSTITETTIVDRTKKEELHSELVRAAPATNWALYGMVGVDRSYGLGVQRRILGNIFIGGYADTNQRLGVSLGILF